MKNKTKPVVYKNPTKKKYVTKQVKIKKAKPVTRPKK
jgi:hypothetical protein